MAYCCWIALAAVILCATQPHVAVEGRRLVDVDEVSPFDDLDRRGGNKSRERSGKGSKSRRRSFVPSNTPSTAPSDVPSTTPSIPPLIIADIMPPECVDNSADSIGFFSGNATDARPPEVDMDPIGILDPAEDLNGNGLLDVDTGISFVSLLNVSYNLQLTVDSFNPGDPSVSFSATRIDDSQPANGTIIVTDVAGNACFLDVALDPFDQDLFDSLFGFPALAHQTAFNSPSADEVPIYDIAGLMETIGVYNGANEDTTAFTLNVTEILVTSQEISADLLADTETPADVLAFVQDQSYSSFVLRGMIVGPVAIVEVVALAFTTATLSPDFSLVVIYDPLDPQNGLTNFTDTESTRMRNLRIAGADSLQMEAVERVSIVTRGIQSKDDVSITTTFARRQLQGCSSGLSEITCPPRSSKRINGACVKAASSAFQLAVDVAQGDYDTAIALVQAVYDGVIIALNVRKARDYAKQLVPCVVIGALVGPVGFAACAARALAICVAKQTALRLAAQAALELGIRNADLVLEAAIAGACALLRATVRTCVECEGEPCKGDSDCNSEEYPDPHFRTWNSEYYDFHGACDMIYVRNDLLELHIRTERRGSWSAVSRTALRLGSDTLEVLLGGAYLVNGVEPATPPAVLGGMYPLEVSSGSIFVRLGGGQYIEFRNFFSNIVIRIDAHGSDFLESAGMAGTWSMFGLVGRDRNTTFTDTSLFAEEWEVNATLGDPILFTTPAESMCIEAPEMFTPDPALLAVAEAACADLLEGQPEREACIFDVLATGGDVTWAENPAYTDPLVSTQRCVANLTPVTDPAMMAGPSCADLGGECVFRCNADEQDCIEGSNLCVENADLTEVDGGRRRRRLNIVDGCSCARPTSPSQSPSVSMGKGGNTEKSKKMKKGETRNERGKRSY